ncbi:hypothetical protein GCM10027346_26540 [Hymenobacter seoulensis]
MSNSYSYRLPALARFLAAPLGLGLLLTACNSGSDSSASQTTATTPAGPADSPGTWYRQYRGLLPGSADSVTIHLQNLGDIPEESTLGPVVGYYATSDGRPYELSGVPGINPDSLYLRDVSVEVVGDKESGPRWMLKQDGTRLVGTRDGQPVVLRRLQPPVGVSFVSRSFSSEVPARPGQPQDSVSGRITMQALIPVSGASKDALAANIVRGLRGDSVETKPAPALEDVWKEQSATFTRDYQKEVGPLVAKPKTPSEYSPQAALAYEQSSNTYVLWNDGNLLSLGYFGYDFSGGAHGMYGTYVRSYDTRTGRGLGYDDIFREGTKKQLEAVIGRYARPALGLQPNEPLSTELTTNTLPVTRNVYLTSGGAVFVYLPFEVASFDQGEIKVFVPMVALQSFLKPGLPIGGGGAVATR